MHFIFVLLIAVRLFLGTAAGFALHRARNNAAQFPQVLLGPEGSDPATTEFQLNHVTFNTRNLARSLEFYRQVFGMREITTIRVTEHFSATYLGYSHAGKNGTGYMTTEELMRQQRNSQGLLELLFLDAPNSTSTIPSSTQSTNTFSLIGFVVPDTKVVQARLERFGVMIYKKIGEPTPEDGPFNRATNLVRANIDPAEFATIHDVLSSVQTTFIFAADPDGNLIEIMPQE